MREAFYIKQKKEETLVDDLKDNGNLYRGVRGSKTSCGGLLRFEFHIHNLKINKILI